jgi:hypothetical protein
LSVPTGYQPERVDALRLQTIRAIDELGRLRSSDPAAADAMRAIHLTRRTLEEHWMPLITLIRTSDAMINWTRSALEGLRRFGSALDDWFSFDDATGGRSTRYAGMSDDELIDQLFAAGQSDIGGLASGSLGQSFDDLMASDDPFWSDEFPEMAIEISRRVGTDPLFARRATTDMPDVPLLAVAIGYADFPASYVRDGLTQMLHAPEWSDEVYTAGVRAAAEQLLDGDPSHLLDVLLDQAALRSLMEPTQLDDDLVTSVIRAGLYDAVMAEAGRLEDGATVLRSLTELANDELDRGATEAGCLAVADSMMLYVEHIAPGISGESETSLVHLVEDPATRLKVSLGEYPDVKDLFGMILRHESSRVTLALVLDGYTDHVVAGLGADIADRHGLEFVARFADLLDEGLRDEHLEEAMAAAAASAHRQRVGHLIGLGAGIGLIGAGIGPILRAMSAEVINGITDEVADGDDHDDHGDDHRDGSFRIEAYDKITLSALELLVSTPSVRVELGVDAVSAASWSALEGHLGEIAALEPGPERQMKQFDLTLFVREHVPELGEFLRRIRTSEIDGLLQATTGADLGDDD